MLRRAPENPILTRDSLPDMAATAGSPRLVDPSSVFNPGTIEFEGRIHLMLRVQARSRVTHLVMASSADGRSFEVAGWSVRISGLESVGREFYHVYDPRLTRIGDEFFVCFAVDAEDGCHVGLARSRDLRSFELVSLDEELARNAVLFPRRSAAGTCAWYGPINESCPGACRRATRSG